MNTDKRFLNYKKYENFLLDLEHGNIPEDTIVFIQDKGCIWARGKEYIASDNSWAITEVAKAINDLTTIIESKTIQTTTTSSIDEKLINAKLQTLQEYLANQYVLKKDIQHPESEEWSEATIYPFGELPEADVDDTRKHVNIVAVDEDVFNPDDIQTDVCYFIYKKS